MAKTVKTQTIPNGFKVSESRKRNGEARWVAFVDKDAGVFESRKGAIAASGVSREDLIAKLNDPAIMSKVTRVSRTATAKPTAKKAAAAQAEEHEALD